MPQVKILLPHFQIVKLFFSIVKTKWNSSLCAPLTNMSDFQSIFYSWYEHSLPLTIQKTLMTSIFHTTLERIWYGLKETYGFID